MAHVRIELVFAVAWEHIDAIRKLVAIAVRAAYAGVDGLDEAVAMVSAELLENAVKYGAEGDADVRFALTGDGERLEIQVSNRAGGDLGHVDRLRDRLAWLEGFPTPADAYLAAFEERYQGASGRTSGLGLVRVAHEGGCEVSVESRQRDVTVRACRPVVVGT
jgi:hypothetical protein